MMSDLKEMPMITPNEFVFTQVFHLPRAVENNQSFWGNPVNFIGLEWNTVITKNQDQLGVFLYCYTRPHTAINTETQITLISSPENFVARTAILNYSDSVPSILGFSEFVNWDQLTRDFMKNDRFVVRIRVKILGTIGFLMQ